MEVVHLHVDVPLPFSEVATSSSASVAFVPFTSSRYHIARDKRFSLVSDADVGMFESIVGRGNVITSLDECSSYNTDWLRIYRGQSSLVLRPQETGQVSEILRWCNQKRLAVVPQGGNTSLVGGAIPVFDEIVISMSLMNRILDFDPVSGVMCTQAGAILRNLEDAANKHDRLVPVDLGAKESCHIGGNAMTCAGGIRLFSLNATNRYGSLHANILGLEMVLADGSILPIGTAQLKDNTGYHMHHLFLGSEGTLGICTAVAIKCPVVPACRHLMFLGLPSFSALMKTFQLAESTLNELLSAFEYLDNTAMQSVVKNLRLNSPLSASHAFYAVVEVSGSDGENIQTRLEGFLERAMSHADVADGTVAASYDQQRSLWQFRERIIDALILDGYCYKFDLSVSKQKMYEIVERIREHFADDIISVTGYGHLGDNNLHLGVTATEFDEKFYNNLTQFVFERVCSYGGSISAEHGIGLKLAPYVGSMHGGSYTNMCRSIKRLFDPNEILNPYKMLPSRHDRLHSLDYDSV